MSFGDHLDELRRCLIRALVGVVVAMAVTLYFGTEILEIIYRPLLIVQYYNGLQPKIQVLSPTGAFSAYLKIALLSGLILGMPWILYQVWSFVAAGLYSHERRFLKSLVPGSLFLFVLGVAFLYYVALPMVLQFFISFNKAFDVPELAPSGFQSILLPNAPIEPQVDAAPPLNVPLLSADPPHPRNGDVWVNAHSRRLLLKTPTETWSMPFDPTPTATTMHSEFALDYYVSFVLMLALAFGIAFETPIVVFFLAWTGLVSVSTMTQGRRYVILGVVVVAAVLTPPDVVSQMLLAIPMYLLFELGLLAARLAARRRQRTEAA